MRDSDVYPSRLDEQVGADLFDGSIMPQTFMSGVICQIQELVIPDINVWGTKSRHPERFCKDLGVDLWISRACKQARA